MLRAIILSRLVILLLAAGSAVANSDGSFADPIPTRGCFRKHLLSAIERNNKRRHTYSKLTDGASDKIFLTLLISDTIGAQTLGRLHDLRATYWQKSGIPIVCEELFPVILPPFQTHVDIPMPVKEFKLMGGHEIAKKISAAYEAYGWDGVIRETNTAIDSIADQSNFHCLMHNELTSIRRIATLAPKHMAKAKDLGIKSPEKISRMLMNAELMILGSVDRIDRSAYASQVKGVPMLCQDFPGFSAD